MKSNTTFLDTKILYIFIITFLMSAGVLAYKASTALPCNEVVFATVEKEYTVGELVKFEDATEGAKTREWDFGDGTRKSSRVGPLHLYKSPGEYEVTLKVNNACYLTKTIVISERKKLLDPEVYPVFELQESIAFGEPLTVIDQTKDAISWEWRFGETSGTNATTQTATYEFIEPGLKTVSLIVNGNLDYITKKKINVLPPAIRVVELIEVDREKPAGRNIKDKPIGTVNEVEIGKKDEDLDKEKSIVVPYISDIEFKRRILMVADKKMRANDFSEYFCGDINRTAVVNGDNTTFSALCEEIKGKNIKIKSLVINRNSSSNCIKSITIEYKKKGWF